jgi:DNA-binding transcriptional LysR family regulator
VLDPDLSRVVSSIAATLTKQNPTLRVELTLDDAQRDLVQERLDIALRLGPLVESTYVVRKLASEAEIVVASPALLEDWPSLESPKGLSRAPWVAHSGLRTQSTWSLRSDRGDKVTVSANVRVTTNTVVAMRDLLVAGAGFGVLPTHMVRTDIRSGRLVQVCPGWFHRRFWLHALLPTRQSPPRVRAFLSALTREMGSLGFDSARSP